MAHCRARASLHSARSLSVLYRGLNERWWVCQLETDKEEEEDDGKGHEKRDAYLNLLPLASDQRHLITDLALQSIFY
jgi:hypothetical protein